MSATPRSQAYTISSATPPREYSDFKARILVRVADTSPRSNQEGATGNGANRANAMMMTYKTPAILALTRGDLSTVPFAIFGSLHAKNTLQGSQILLTPQPAASKRLICPEIGKVAHSTSVRPPSVPVLVAKGMSNGARDLFGNSCTATPVLRRWLDRPIRRSEVRA